MCAMLLHAAEVAVGLSTDAHTSCAAKAVHAHDGTVEAAADVESGFVSKEFAAYPVGLILLWCSLCEQHTLDH